MNTCPNCGKMSGIHGSVLQGCMCQYSMQAPPQRAWVGLTDEEINIQHIFMSRHEMVRYFEAKLKAKNSL